MSQDAATFLKGRKALTPATASEPADASQEARQRIGDADAETASVKVFRDTTPSGLVVEYCPGDGAKVKRWYSVNGEKVPSVTTVLDCLSKPGLSWWGMKVGVEGVLELLNRDKLGTRIDWQDNKQEFVELHEDHSITPATSEALVALLTSQKLTVNHVLTKAADRGTNVHDALEQWARSGGEFFPTPQNFPDEERPYVEALLSWADTLDGAAEIAGYEVMVGSAEHGFAGRYDVTIQLNEARTFVQKAYKRKDNIEIEVKPGRYTLDAKTSKDVYTSHFRQLAGYEIASVESGYEPTDGQFVLHLMADGRYEFVPSPAKADDFLSALAVYKSEQRLR